MNHALLPRIGTASLPAKYEAAKAALMQCDRLDECKDWADKSKALASYARQSQDKEMEKTAMRIRARAIRRCGELLKQIEKATGPGRGKKGGDASPRLLASQQAGLSPDQAKDAIRVANIGQELFESQIESPNPPTITSLAEQGMMKGIPLYQQLGMTKKAFQAGMYFRGELESYVKYMGQFDPQDVVDGSSKDQRKIMRNNIEQINEYHNKLQALL